MDDWAAKNQEDVIAQIGNGDYLPQHMQYSQFMGLEEYNNNISQASLFISHAGMGNIISARENATPIIVINRRADLGEHRNDHQLEGLQWMGELDGVYTASTQEELNAHLNAPQNLTAANSTDDAKLSELADFLDQKIKDWG